MLPPRSDSVYSSGWVPEIVRRIFATSRSLGIGIGFSYAFSTENFVAQIKRRFFQVFQIVAFVVAPQHIFHDISQIEIHVAGDLDDLYPRRMAGVMPWMIDRIVLFILGFHSILP